MTTYSAGLKATLTDNGDGTFTHDDGLGNLTTFSAGSGGGGDVSTFVDNGDGTWTHTAGGVVTVVAAGVDGEDGIDGAAGADGIDGADGIGAPANSGVVKINGHSTGWIPTAYTGGVHQQITVGFPLVVSSSTDWPAQAVPEDADIYLPATGKWIENPIEWQVTMWRVILDWSRTATSTSEAISFILTNPISGFHISTAGVVLKGHTGGDMGLSLISIADANSIGVGYELFLEATDDMDIDIQSITRISVHRDNTNVSP